ncbi:hypothetical protein AK51_05135 [Serratia nematodiphila DZ0503SBS1]|nr:hypothetical protein AK51_05135 [Serratia nematodiphila DZ0503SBS1]
MAAGNVTIIGAFVGASAFGIARPLQRFLRAAVKLFADLLRHRVPDNRPTSFHTGCSRRC